MVFLCDVSGSMEPYARAMVMFLQAMTQAGRRVEAFAFGTRLTRLTPALSGRDPAQALRLAAEAMPDWGGGTRIGESLAAYNAKYGRASMTRGAVVVIVSDGWERGGLEQLDHELARIARSAHLLVWVNPLKGHTGFEPLAGGMRVALPARRRVPGGPQSERDRLAGGGAGRGQLMQGPVETGVFETLATTDRIASIGTPNPPWPALSAANIMATTRPAGFTTGPPESPCRSSLAAAPRCARARGFRRRRE